MKIGFNPPVFAFFIFLLIGAYALKDTVKFLVYGIKVQGEVLSVERAVGTSNNSLATYINEVRYKIDELEYNNNFTTSGPIFQAGDKVELIVLSNNHQAIRHNQRPGQIYEAPIVVFTLAFILGLFCWVRAKLKERT